ncbi:MAG TPA: alanine--glyoxylate aminotransferase family protein, partial [Ilumatobacter sp.]|nr:alanine--glyoxylate aminotransferase family protein [Ilumatobacter sp.]
GVPPGLAPLTVSDRALGHLRPTPQSWYLDLNMIANYVTGSGARAYHHTAPISMIYALHAGLGVVLEEGLEACQARHQAVGDALQAGLESRGFELFAAAGHRLPQLTSVRVPAEKLGADGSEGAVRSRLLHEYGIEIGGGLGELAGQGWRIGLMGHTARMRNVTLLLAALDDIFE